MSDSNYAAATRHRKPNSTAGRPFPLEIVDDEWAADHLSDDEIDCHQQEAAIQPLLGDIDVDAVVVSTGHNDATQNESERRRREEGRWNDLGLDRFDNATSASTTEAATVTNDNNSQNQ
jgi:hypothetical protein